MAALIHQRVQERADLKVEALGLLEATERSQEQEARLTEIEAAIGKLDKDIERLAKLQDEERAAAPASKLEVGKDHATDRPWGYEVPANASQAERERATEAAFGEFLGAVANVGKGKGVDARLYAAVSGASSGVPADGGFLVRPEWNTMLLNRAMESAVIAPLCTEIPVGPDADGVEMPYISETSRATGSRWGGVQVYRAGEADTVTAKKPKFEQFEIRLTDIMGLMYATDRLLRDAQAFGSIASRAFASEFAFKLDDEIINGTGAGECMGLLNASATVSVAKETNQAAATFNTTNISKMWVRMDPRRKGNAVWLVNHEVGPQLDELVLPAGTAGLQPRFVTYGADGILRIKGRPVIEVEQCAALGTVGDVILADLSDYLLVTKGGINAAQSMHVRFLFGENTFRWTRSVNGSPATRSAVTAYKGAASLTPYVTLATRA